ncbi:hypothetical protein SmJEL517_g00659 [Synchytrium microbalum]|uniref:Cytochrome P450 n=1 Tax=Synchytrium microbalum TaxID=1806994 RepID=A0A507C7N7_9FUNG|nr:uncharacterized protein SmJEL517_g00659 [Synchytrium microbalum]TPX37590.1 hypothetical protein SmJEL517_g00659 [Synchytrium microbalum]
MSNIKVLQGTAVAVVGVALATTLYIVTRRRTKEIPSDYVYPIIGNMLQIAKYAGKDLVHEYFLFVGEKYGKIARFVVGTERIMVNDAAEAKRILLSSEFEKTVDTRNFAGIAENGLIGLDGDKHKLHRKALQPAFGPSRLRHAFSQSVTSTKQLIEQWKSQKGDINCNLLHNMNCITLDVIGKVALSQDLRMVESAANPTPEGQLLKSQMNTVVKTLMKRLSVPSMLWPLFGLSKADINRKTKLMLKSIGAPIDMSAKTVNEKFEKTIHWDVMDRLLAGNVGAKGVGVVFNDEEIADETFVFFLAGSDTTALTLTNLFVQLADHPDVVKKLQAEIDAVIGAKGVFTQEMLPQLKFLDCAVKEVMRLLPVALAVQARTPVAPTTLCGYQVYPGQSISINTGAIHRNPEYWHHPDKFWPERWESDFMPVPGSYVPFGDGIANCIGQRLANLESRTVAALLLQSFDIELPEGQDLARTTVSLTGYKPGLQFRFKPRAK